MLIEAYAVEPDPCRGQADVECVGQVGVNLAPRPRAQMVGFVPDDKTRLLKVLVTSQQRRDRADLDERTRICPEAGGDKSMIDVDRCKLAARSLQQFAPVANEPRSKVALGGTPKHAGGDNRFARSS